MDNHNVVVYKTESSNVKLEVKVSDETVWLTQTQMAILFGCSTDNISLHLKNIYEEHEIDSNSTSENFSVVRLDGQIFDAYNFISDLVRKAKNEIILIDNYVDDSVLKILNKREDNVSATIYTAHISENLKLDLEKHNSQYQPINIKQFNKSHDRFMIIDNDVYHIGASLKDLGKRMFAFSKMEIGKEIILSIL